VHPQKASQDALGLLERPIARQTKVGARRKSKHAARDRGHESKQKRSRKHQIERTMRERGELARNKEHRDTRHERDMKETQKSSCNARPQRTGLWPRRRRFVAEGEVVAPFIESKQSRTRSRGLETGRRFRRTAVRERCERETRTGRTVMHKSRFRGQPRSWLYINYSCTGSLI
jgi:hypothetical protein